MECKFRLAFCNRLLARSPLQKTVLLPSIAWQSRPIILQTRLRMQRFALLLLAAILPLIASVARAQGDDPSETFLKAYMTAQQGEKLERDNQFAGALSKYRFAGSLLEELKKSHSSWQPAIVEYRSRKISESILRVQSKTGTQQELAANNTPVPSPTARSNEPLVEIGRNRQTIVRPADELVSATPASSPLAAASSKADEAAIKDATAKLRDKVEQLQADLQQSRSRISQVEREKDALNGKLRDSDSKLEAAQRDLDKSRGAEKGIRDQLTTAQSSLEKIRASGANSSSAQAALQAEIVQLKKALASAEEGRTSAEKERDTESAKVTEVSKQRDDALSQVAGMKDSERRVQMLAAENVDLKQKLASAEKTVREISEDKPQKEQELSEVKRSLETLRGQLAASEKQNKEFEATVATLRGQLEDASGALERAKLTGANGEETARLTKENQVLRNIVVRERQEEARREQAKKLMLAEFDKLKIKSESLNEQIALLAQPVTKLTDEELKLLREPVVSIADDSSNTIKASFTFAKPGSSDKPVAQDKTENAPPPTLESGAKPEVPADVADIAREAKENFDKGKYHAAERGYQDLLAKNPGNLYALSNLGVVYFRTGKLKAAELTLKKAIAASPKDEFARTTLGIVYYRQSKYDDALNELTKALVINPRSASAHNYLGITASQKGWQEAAEKELLEAIQIKPDYADAHFNLAVIYATSQPPSKELAKRHYSRATECGADPDASLEKLLR